MPRLILLAGPNGAGKSTFFESYLSHLDLPFLNADHLAQYLTIDAYTAAKQIARVRDEFILKKKSFITETVFSDPVGEKLSVLENAAQLGYTVDLIYVGIDSPSQSKKRIASRVAAGGHDVPAENRRIPGRHSPP